MKSDYDTIIIGAGVAGMTAAIYLKRAGFNCCIFEKEIPGGQITKSSSVKNYPGFKEISGPDLAQNIYEQVKEMNVEYKNVEVLQIALEDELKVVKTNKGDFTAKTIIVATGRSPRRLKIKNEEELVGKGISYCALCDGNFFKNKDVVVIGGSNSALEEASYLSNICSQVTVVNRSDELRGDKIFQEELAKKENVKILKGYQIKEFIEENDRLKEVVIERDGNEEHLLTNGCFIYIGQVPASTRFKDVIDFDDDGYIKVNENYETSLEGIYAAGDIIKKQVYQLLTAMGDAVIASVNCIKYLKSK